MELDCRRASEQLPALVRGALDADAAARVHAHVGACAACRAELALVRRLFAGAADPPWDLAARVHAAVREDARRATRDARAGWPSRRRAWGVATAAALVIGALGTLTMQLLRGPSVDELWQAYAAKEPPAWVLDDGLVAGAPVLEDLSGLSDEDLAGVLQEMGP